MCVHYTGAAVSGAETELFYGLQLIRRYQRVGTADLVQSVLVLKQDVGV
jgi:hypothetical protein